MHAVVVANCGRPASAVDKDVEVSAEGCFNDPVPEDTNTVPTVPRKKWPIFLGVIFVLLVIAFLTKSIFFNPVPRRPQIVNTTTAVATQSRTSSIRYLLFQSFWGAQNPHVAGLTSDSGDGAAPLPWGQALYKAHLEVYVDTMNSSLGTITLASDREYGFSVGPVTLEQTDQDLKDSITTAFTVALEKNVAVGIHIDVSHYWRFVRAADGTQLSSLTGAQDVRAWQNWQGTIAPIDPWDSVPTLMPSMCFECSAVKAMVDYKAQKVIGPALAAGIARLKASGKENLFAGAMIGWEAGSTNLIDYHSLTIKGYSAAHPPSNIDEAEQQVLNDYLTGWTSDLSPFVSEDKLYTHIGGTSDDPTSANVSSYQWEAFTPHARGGFSMYPQSKSDFEGIWSVAQTAHKNWALAEGVDVMLGAGGVALPSPIMWETYLGSVFNHDGMLANILGAFLPQPAGGFTTASESADAIAAYRKFLTGGTLVETKGAPSLSDKMHTIQSLAPAYMQAHPESVAQIQSMFEQITRDEKLNNIADIETLLDQLLKIVGAV